jgi:hypothetical protein
MAEENKGEPVIQPGGELSESELDKASGGGSNSYVTIGGITGNSTPSAPAPTAPGIVLPTVPVPTKVL